MAVGLAAVLCQMFPYFVSLFINLQGIIDGQIKSIKIKNITAL
jgi:hypothetical protein